MWYLIIIKYIFVKIKIFKPKTYLLYCWDGTLKSDITGVNKTRSSRYMISGGCGETKLGISTGAIGLDINTGLKKKKNKISR